MFRPWRAGGDGRPVSFPHIPWHDERPAEHVTAIAEQEAIPGTQERSQFYFYCTCGVCGKPRWDRLDAAEDGIAHVEAVPT